MELFATVQNFWDKNRKWLKIAAPCILAVLFIGSILLAIFIGGEFAASDSGEVTVKGLLRIEKAEYNTEYSVGDKFVFDDENCVISLIAKDPAIEDLVKVDKLPRPEFGFKINGEGEIISDPSSIVITEDVECVSVVSTYYKNLKADIYITIDGAELEANNG